MAGLIMGIVVYGSNCALNLVLGQAISTLLSILIGVITYGITVLMLKILAKEDILMLPFGTKIYNILLKMKLYV